jgi:hypothetical protein
MGQKIEIQQKFPKLLSKFPKFHNFLKNFVMSSNIACSTLLDAKWDKKSEVKKNPKLLSKFLKFHIFLKNFVISTNIGVTPRWILNRTKNRKTTKTYQISFKISQISIKKFQNSSGFSFSGFEASFLKISRFRVRVRGLIYIKKLYRVIKTFF